jgi:hypothetical protein
MNIAIGIAIFLIGLFVGMLICLEAGRRLRLHRLEKDPKYSEGAGAGLVDGAVFALLGLLIAFTFSGAASRFDVRRALIVEEANAIGTAYLRIDLLPASSQPGLRENFRQYLDARLAFYRALPDVDAAKGAADRVQSLQKAIWVESVEACRVSGSSSTSMLVLSALNQMIDITTTRSVALQTHPPLIVYGMLGVLVLACSFLVGYKIATRGRTRNWIHIAIFAIAMSITIYVILDLEFPRVGFIRIDAVDQLLAELRNSMR